MNDLWPGEGLIDVTASFELRSSLVWVGHDMKNEGEGGAPKVGGTPTFLALDIESSDYVYNREIDLVSRVMGRYRQFLAEIVTELGGTPIKDLCIAGRHMSAFDRPSAAILAAFKLNRTFAADPEFVQIPIHAKIAIATGEMPQDLPLARSGALRRADALEKKAKGEQILVTLATQDLVRDILPDDFGFLDVGTLQPAAGMRSERVFQLTHPELPTDFAPIDGLDVVSHNIPPRLSFFLGREQEIEELLEALDHSRLVTLIGTGGVGKTALAARVAIGIVEDFEDGIRFVDFSPVASGDHVVSTIAEALRVRQRPGMSLEQSLFAEMGAKQFMLLLDNCDLVAEEMAAFAERFLRACTRAQLLITSRKPLGAEGETIYLVPSLAVPRESETSLEEIAQYDAIALFIDRVQSQQKGFVLTESNVAAVVRICRRLDGIPLALELVAARALVLPFDEILARLDDRFGLLDTEQALHEMVDWSYGQLSESGRVLFRRLAVFAGGWTLAAAQNVCADKRLNARQIRESLDQLTENSMVIRTFAGGLEGTFGFLETIRAFAREKLAQSGEEKSVRERHSAWCLDLAKRSEPHLEGPDQAFWLELLDRNRDNLRAAIDWALRPDADPAEGYAFVPVCFPLWLRRSWHADGRSVVERILERDVEKDSIDRARALNVRGLLATRQGHFNISRKSLYEALRIYERLDDPPGIASVYNNLAIDSLDQGNRAQGILEFEETVTRWRSLGNLAKLYPVLGGYADALVVGGRLSEAEAILDEAVLIGSQIQDRFVGAAITFCRGELAMARGDSELAETLFREHVVACNELGNLRELSNSLRMLAYISVRRGAYERAALLMGADIRCRHDAGTVLSPRESPQWESAVALLRNELGYDRFAEISDRAYGLSGAQVVWIAANDGFLSN